MQDSCQISLFRRDLHTSKQEGRKCLDSLPFTLGRQTWKALNLSLLWLAVFPHMPFARLSAQVTISPVEVSFAYLAHHGTPNNATLSQGGGNKRHEPTRYTKHPPDKLCGQAWHLVEKWVIGRGVLSSFTIASVFEVLLAHFNGFEPFRFICIG